MPKYVPVTGIQKIIVIAKENETPRLFAKNYKVDIEEVLALNEHMEGITASSKFKANTEVYVPISTTTLTTKYLIEHCTVKDPKTTWHKMRTLPITFCSHNPRRRGSKQYAIFAHYQGAKRYVDYEREGVAKCHMTKSELVRNFKWMCIAGHVSGQGADYILDRLVAKEGAALAPVTPPPKPEEDNSEDERIEKSKAIAEAEAEEQMNNLMKLHEKPVRAEALAADWRLTQGQRMQTEAYKEGDSLAWLAETPPSDCSDDTYIFAGMSRQEILECAETVDKEWVLN